MPLGMNISMLFILPFGRFLAPQDKLKEGKINLNQSMLLCPVPIVRVERKETNFNKKYEIFGVCMCKFHLFMLFYFLYQQYVRKNW